MKKVPTLFVRDPQRRDQVTPQVAAGLDYILRGEARATEKIDGTSCMIRDGRLFKRYMVKWERKAPADFEPTGAPDPTTGKQPGWVPVGDGPDDRWHREAFGVLPQTAWLPGTYELIGPKVQSNPYRRPDHVLVAHGKSPLDIGEFSFDSLRAFLAEHECEGIVWWMGEPVAKIKRRDFGLPWPVEP